MRFRSTTHTINSIYKIILCCYFLVALAYFFRYEISYRIINVTPKTVEERDLTYEEYKALQNSINIRETLSTVMIVSSALVAIYSFAILYYKPFPPGRLIKLVFVVSIVLAAALFILKGIGFIPVPPIR